MESVHILSRFVTSGNFVENFIADIIINFIFAGRETTSAALTWFFWLLHKNPRIETEILKEIKQKSENLIYDEAKDMVYTHASLCESMRLCPSVAVDEKFAADNDILPVVGVRLGGVPTREVVGEGCVGEVVFQAGLRVCLGREIAFL
ncbi:hypothetical protein L6452_38986 [Arctium lappa]|uniref:Uncharacterized protein n=1 Tax=Arctium lappa TaxID=4217 RepID=A0ACB8XRT2_ARCLA|nr:hypothetical protein L6452_38986 [Arctium lappa]